MMSREINNTYLYNYISQKHSGMKQINPRKVQVHKTVKSCIVLFQSSNMELVAVARNLNKAVEKLHLEQH